LPPTQLAPSAKTAGARRLTLEGREDIAIALSKGAKARYVGRSLGRCASTISWVLRSSAAAPGGSYEYRDSTPKWRVDRAACLKSSDWLVMNSVVCDIVQDQLAGQIARPDE
jgi:IS30 family transposase